MRHTVLFVDDEVRVLDGLRRGLRNQLFTSIYAQSAAEGLELLASEHVDAVVSDQNMPGMNGVDFLTKVRDERPEALRFLLTGEATLDLAIAAINDVGITRFFTKPCNPVDLGTTVRHALEHRELIRVTRRLTARVRDQAAILDRIEDDYPGISEVHRDAEGAVMVEGTQSIEEILREAEACFG